MKTFSPSEAAFEGFRLMRRRPGALVVWTLLYLLFVGLMVGLVAWAFLPDAPAFMAHIAAAQAASAAGTPTPPDTAWLMPLMMKVRLVQWILAPVSWAVMVILACGIYRAIQRPEDRGLAYLKIGGDEFRLFAVLLIYFFLGVAVGLGLVIVGGICFGALYFAAAKTQYGGWATLAGVIALVGLICAFMWLAVRLSLTWPISFAERRLALFDSWRLTRGRFWSILGCYLLAWIFAMVVSFVFMAMIGVLALVAMIVMAGQMHTGATPDWVKLTPLFMGLGGVWLVVATIMSTVIRVIVTAPSMAIYKALVLPPPEPGVNGDPWAAAPGRSTGLVL